MNSARVSHTDQPKVDTSEPENFLINPSNICGHQCACAYLKTSKKSKPSHFIPNEKKTNETNDSCRMGKK